MLDAIRYAAQESNAYVEMCSICGGKVIRSYDSHE